MNRTTFFSSAVLLASCWAARAPAQEVLLRYTPAVASVVRYRTVTQTWMAGMSRDTTVPATQLTVYTTRTVTGMDGAARVVTTVVDSTKNEMPGMGPVGAFAARMARDMMRGMSITEKIDERGRILSREVTPPQGMQAQAAQGSARNTGRVGPALPERAVRPGDTWTDTMVSSTSAGRGQQIETTILLTLKLERVEQQAGTRVAIISMNGTVQVDSGGGAARRGMTSGTMTGEVAVALDTGRMTHTTSNLNAVVQTDRGSMPLRTKTDMEALP
jgi:hypothetical protein